MTCVLGYGRNRNQMLEWRTFGQIQWHVIPEPPATLQVLPPGEFNVMIPVLRVILQGAATRRFQWHVIPEPRITLQGAIAGCKNSIRHIENRVLPCFIF